MWLSDFLATRVNEKLPEVRTDAGYGEFFREETRLHEVSVRAGALRPDTW